VGLHLPTQKSAQSQTVKAAQMDLFQSDFVGLITYKPHLGACNFYF